MKYPNRIESAYADDAPLDSDMQRLVMWIRNHPDTRNPRGVFRSSLEQSLRRTCSMPHKRSLLIKLNSVPPIF